MAKSLARKDNGPMTVRDVMSILQVESKTNPKFLDQPVTLSSDEEGNGFNNLHSVEISKQGVTLWPM